MAETLRVSDVSERLIVPDPEAIGREAADHVVTVIDTSVKARHKCMIALSGGTTPRHLYERLASEDFASKIPWSSTFWFFGDERHVPPDHEDSNYRMAAESLLDRVPIPIENIYRIHAEKQDPPAVAAQYELTVRKAFYLTPGEIPIFDLILLGLGADGHMASLFPRSDALRECERLVTAAKHPSSENWRITLTVPVLNEAREILFIVAGEEKAEAVQRVLTGADDPEQYPALLIRQKRGFQRWIIDQAAASQLAE